MTEPAADLAAAVLKEARLWIGTPYCHQASCRGAGADCLGLIRGVWRAVLGPEPAEIAPYTADWAEAQGEERLLEAAHLYLRPKPLAAAALGDVLLFRMREGGLAKHLGLQSALMPQARFIHAYSGHRVCETTLTAPWAKRLAARFSFPQR